MGLPNCDSLQSLNFLDLTVPSHNYYLLPQSSDQVGLGRDVKKDLCEHVHWGMNSSHRKQKLWYGWVIWATFGNILRPVNSIIILCWSFSCLDSSCGWKKSSCLWQHSAIGLSFWSRKGWMWIYLDVRSTGYGIWNWHHHRMTHDVSILCKDVCHYMEPHSPIGSSSRP